MLHDRLHGVEGSVGQTAALSFSFIVCLVEMLLVEEALELVVVGLDLRLRSWDTS